MTAHEFRHSTQSATGMAVLALGVAALFALPASALDLLDLPRTAQSVTEDIEPLGSYAVPVGPYRNGGVSTISAEGEVRRSAWHVAAPGITTLQLLAPLRDQLAAAGFKTLYECEAKVCGGFDFRYATSVLPAPSMHVDLGDFRFFAAKREGEGKDEFVSLIVSRTSDRGFIQVTRVGPKTGDANLVVASTKSPVRLAAKQAVTVAADGTLANRLESNGRAVLGDLEFKTGSSSLGDSAFASLEALATYLKANPARGVILVGHTDAEGSLAGNIALSKKRAAAVRARLISTGGVPSTQVRAEGVGYLAPLASNLTAEGRTANRRVEAILSVVK